MKIEAIWIIVATFSSALLGQLIYLYIKLRIKRKLFLFYEINKIEDHVNDLLTFEKQKHGDIYKLINLGSNLFFKPQIIKTTSIKNTYKIKVTYYLFNRKNIIEKIELISTKCIKIKFPDFSVKSEIAKYQKDLNDIVVEISDYYSEIKKKKTEIILNRFFWFRVN